MAGAIGFGRETGDAMRVLLTNNTLDERAGTELYVRDLAIELLRRGHQPVAYSTKLGAVANELRAATVPVIARIDSLGEVPDIIHGHHHREALTAMLHFPQTPAIYYCHGWLPYEEAPLRFPRIRRYVAVDDVCRERLIAEGGIPPDRIDVILNFFDPARFPHRGPLPSRPKKALAFGNTFKELVDLPILRKACAKLDIELHATGLGVGYSERDPGRLLGEYDVVFAKARAALEAMAVGCAVVLAMPGRLGQMVVQADFAALRQVNFGIRTLSRPLEVESLISELRRYDATEAAGVSMLVRQNCTLGAAVDQIVAIYEAVVAENRAAPVTVSVEADRAAAQYLEGEARRWWKRAGWIVRWVRAVVAILDYLSRARSKPSQHPKSRIQVADETSTESHDAPRPLVKPSA